MDNLFSIGQVSKIYNISKQTLIFYHKKGLLTPSFINNNNGYRYYSFKDLYILDNILLLKEVGVQLKDINKYIKNRDATFAKKLLIEQDNILKNKIKNLKNVKSKLNYKIQFISDYEVEPVISNIEDIHTISIDVPQPYNIDTIDIVNKTLITYMYKNQIKNSFSLGVTIDIKDVLNENFLKQKTAFYICDKKEKSELYKCINKGIYGVIYHKGAYEDIVITYKKLLQYVAFYNYEVIGDSIELCLIDGALEKLEKNYITKILIPIKKQ